MISLRHQHLPIPVTPRARLTGAAFILIPGLLAASMGALSARAQKGGAATTGVIYTCTDAAGRKLTSDRLIDSCLDREQRVLSSRGLLLKTIPPEQTGAQRAAQQAKDRQAATALQRQQEQQRLDQALLVRYPTRDTHEAGRRAALAQTQTILSDAQQRLAALERQRATLTASGPAAQPGGGAQRQRDLASNAQAILAQQRFIAAYQAERDRINAQFDAEDQRLQPLWQNAQAAQP